MFSVKKLVISPMMESHVPGKRDIDLFRGMGNVLHAAWENDVAKIVYTTEAESPFQFWFDSGDSGYSCADIANPPKHLRRQLHSSVLKAYSNNDFIFYVVNRMLSKVFDMEFEALITVAAPGGQSNSQSTVDWSLVYNRQGMEFKRHSSPKTTY